MNEVKPAFGEHRDRAPPGHAVPLREAFGVWLRIAALSFGGPAGQIAVMHRILVEEKHWISESRFLHALNYCMLLPGPEAQQLADLGRSLRVAALWLSLWLIPVAAIVAAFGSDDVFSQIAVFFSKMAMVTFGGAYAVLTYVAQQAVETYGWLRPGEMLDGLGMAETTPGPLIMVLRFVGFMVAFRDPGSLAPLLAGTLGGLLATWVTFTPCFLWIFVGAPYIETLRGNRALSGALAAITAAVVGVILNLALWFAIHTIFAQVRTIAWGPLEVEVPVPESINLWALLLAAAAMVAMFRLKWGMLPTLGATAAAGIALHAAGAIA